MAYMKAGWIAVRAYETVTEYLPSHDVIEHKSQIACVCKPDIQTEIYRNTVYWTVVHNSFDEYLDESETEPYKEL